MIEDQPKPEANEREHIADLVVVGFERDGSKLALQVARDLQDRKQIGIERYGTALQAFNGRDCLVDLYQELLDGLNYAKQRLEEYDSGYEAGIDRWLLQQTYANLRLNALTVRALINSQENS